jgi:hypothetical protein
MLDSFEIENPRFSVRDFRISNSNYVDVGDPLPGILETISQL